MSGSKNPNIFSQNLSSNPSWSKADEILGQKRKCRKMKSRTRVFLMKRRASLERQRRSFSSGSYGIGRRVKTLKKLIPNGESKEIDTLFVDAAEYILALQMRVKAMQMMVDVLSSAASDNTDDHRQY